MAVEETTGITSGDDSEIHDEPHLRGSRITVRYIQRQVDERGLHPATVAEQHDINLAEVYAALSYYYSNPEEMREVEERRAELAEQADEQTTLRPPE